MASNNEKPDGAESAMQQELRTKKKELAELYKALKSTSNEVPDCSVIPNADAAFRYLNHENKIKYQIQNNIKLGYIESLTDSLTSFENSTYAEQYPNEIQAMKEKLEIEKKDMQKQMEERAARILQERHDIETKRRSIEEKKERLSNEVFRMQMEMLDNASPRTSSDEEMEEDQLELQDAPMKLEIFEDSIKMAKDLEEHILKLTKEQEKEQNALIESLKELEKKKTDAQLLAGEFANNANLLPKVEIVVKEIEAIKEEIIARKKTIEKIKFNIQVTKASYADCQERNRGYAQTMVALKQAVNNHKSTSVNDIGAKDNEIEDGDDVFTVEMKLTEGEEPVFSILSVEKKSKTAQNEEEKDSSVEKMMDDGEDEAELAKNDSDVTREVEDQ